MIPITQTYLFQSGFSPGFLAALADAPRRRSDGDSLPIALGPVCLLQVGPLLLLPLRQNFQGGMDNIVKRAVALNGNTVALCES